MLTTALLVSLGAALPIDERPSVGDVRNGAKLFETHCKSRYKETGIGLFRSAEMALMTDAEVLAKVESGNCVTPEQKASFDAMSLSYLDHWDMVAFIRTLHLNLSDYFPDAGRYIAKTYTIDKFGLGRISEVASPLPEGQRSAPVFTFFNFEGEEGNLQFVPQEPIKLDALKKDKKAGYLVFLPMKHEGFEGEVGLAMDSKGVLTKLMVHPDAKGADRLNTSLSGFVGMGRLGQMEPFKVKGKSMAQLSKVVFPLYMRAMETVTMYIREESDRTWAD